MLPRAAVIVGFCLTAACLDGIAEEPAAPLAESARQLKTLQKDEATQRSGVGEEKVRDALPAFSAPAPGAAIDLGAVRPPPEADRSDSPARTTPGSNWLVDGYENLDQKRDDRTGRKRDQTGKRDSSQGGSTDDRFGSDPMRKAADSARQLTTAPADPMAPLMRNWLARSPVSQSVFDAIRRPGTDASGQRRLDDGSAREGLDVPGGRRAPGQEFSHEVDREMNNRQSAATNPYLTGLTTGWQVTPPLAGGTSLSVTPLPSAPSATVRPVPAPPAELERPAARTRTPPPSSTDDAKKYFPQLKKF